MKACPWRGVAKVGTPASNKKRVIPSRLVGLAVMAILDHYCVSGRAIKAPVVERLYRPPVFVTNYEDGERRLDVIERSSTWLTRSVASSLGSSDSSRMRPWPAEQHLDWRGGFDRLMKVILVVSGVVTTWGKGR